MRKRNCWNAFQIWSLALIISVFSLAKNSFSEEIVYDGSCPSNWEPYVTFARDALITLNDDSVFVFIDRSGTVFDCLNMQPDQEIAAWLEGFYSGLPGSGVDLLPNEPTNWPPYVCNIGRFPDEPLSKIYSVLLPAEGSVLESDLCQRRVRNSLDRITSQRIEK